MKNMTTVQRMFFVNISILSIIGIWLTGVEQVHWFVYVVPGALLFAAASGFCIGFEIVGKILSITGFKEQAGTDDPVLDSGHHQRGI